MAFFKKKRVRAAKSDFDAAVREILTRHVPDGVILADDGGDVIKIAGGSFHLRNMRMHWEDQDPSIRYAWLEGSIVEICDRLGSPDDLSEGTLRAGVRSQATLSISNLQMSIDSGGFESSSHIPMRPIAGDLAWCVLVDFPHTMRVAGKDVFEERGVTFDDALAVGQAMLEGPLEEWAVMNNSIFSILAEDDYTASRAFLPGALDRLPFTGDKVIFHPGRRDLMIVSADDPVGIALAAGFIVEHQEVASPVSFTPVVGSNGCWQPLDLAPTHPAYESCRMLSVLDGLLTYEPQQHLLQRQLGDELLVSTFKGVQLDGDVQTYSVWTMGGETLLPHTDLIAIANPQTAEHLMVPWHEAERICQGMFAPTNHYPRRTLVSASPTPAMLEELRRVTIDL